MNRRQFLRTLGLGGITAVQVGAVQQALAALPAGTFAPALAAERDPVAHVISRLTYGVTPELYAYVRRIGVEAFIEEQLAPERIDNSDLDSRMVDFNDVLAQSAGDLARTYRNNRRPVVTALLGGTATRALYSSRQLYERLVEFFSDHFSIFIGKVPLVFLKVDDDRDVIRPNVMTNFRQILGASAHSPAMLIYLDNFQSTSRAPNENYARELMELHTIGVNGGYTEDDVKAVARAFTGWSINRQREGAGALTYEFRPFFHDDGEKTVLGQVLPARGGERDGEMVLDMLAAHPSTARFISAKLARRFVADDPPEKLVEACAQTFSETGGDIRSVLRVIFASDEFWNAPPKFKRPYEYTISLLRALAYDVQNSNALVRLLTGPLQAMGHIPFTWPAPNGFPDVQAAWADNLLMRWNIALAVVSNQARGARPDAEALSGLMEAEGVALELAPMLYFMGHYLFGRALTDQEHDIVLDFVESLPGGTEQKMAAGVGLMMAAPAFQYR